MQPFLHVLLTYHLIGACVILCSGKLCGVPTNGHADPFRLLDQLNGNFHPPIPIDPSTNAQRSPADSNQIPQRAPSLPLGLSRNPVVPLAPWVSFFGKRSLKLRKVANQTKGLASSDDQVLHRVRRIVGGYDAAFGQVCWQAKITVGSRFDQTLCGGSVIGSRTILIAAHCLFDEETKKRVLDQQVRVVVGGMNREVSFPFRNDPTRCAQEFEIERSVVHPDYSYDLNNNDIAVLTLRGQIDLERSGCVCTICLSTRTPVPGEWCVVSGYGEESNDGSNDRKPVPLKWTQLQVRRNSYDGTCAFNAIKSPNGIVRRTTVDGFICAGTQRWQDTCQGDSGGPFVCLDPSFRRYYLAGVTSFGDDCGNGIGGQYTKVSLYLQWILASSPSGDVIIN